MFNKQKILIVGAGYVGAASAISLALLGHQLYIYDTNLKVLDNWGKHQLPFQDFDLIQGYQNLLKSENTVTAIHDFSQLRDLQMVLICVGTPIDADGKYDLSQVKKALAETIQFLNSVNNKEALIIIRSTLPTNCMKEDMYPLVKQLGQNLKSVVYFPEFLREGSALQDLKNPALSILGTDQEFDKKDLVEGVFGLAQDQLKVMGTSEAEMVKISSNIFHALKVSFANEVARCCMDLNINAFQVMEHFCSDNKLNISSAYLTPGFSFGGPCLDKELVGLTSKHDLPVIGHIQQSNELHFNQIVDEIKKLKHEYKKVGVMGLSFKSESTDRRNSPVCRLIDSIQDDFEVFSFNEVYQNVIAKADFLEFVSSIDILLLGSAKLSEQQKSFLTQNNKFVIDLGLNFQNRKQWQNDPKYRSVIV